MFRFKEIREALYFEHSRKSMLDDRKMKYSMSLNWEISNDAYGMYARQFL